MTSLRSLVKKILKEEGANNEEKSIPAKTISSKLGQSSVRNQILNRNLRSLVESGEVGVNIKKLELTQGKYKVMRECKHYYLKKEGMIIRAIGDKFGEKPRDNK